MKIKNGIFLRWMAIILFHGKEVEKLFLKMVRCYAENITMKNQIINNCDKLISCDRDCSLFVPKWLTTRNELRNTAKGEKSPTAANDLVISPLHCFHISIQDIHQAFRST
jgi:hypothetical protein